MAETGMVLHTVTINRATVSRFLGIAHLLEELRILLDKFLYIGTF